MISNLKYPTILSLLIFLFTGCTSSSDSNSAQDSVEGKVNERFLTTDIPDSLITNRKFEQVPAIASSTSGDVLYVAWYSGGAAAGPGNFVTVSTSTDKGATWKNDQLIVYPKATSSRLFDPALWRDNDGQVRLYYGSSKDGLLWDGFGGVNSVDISLTGGSISHSNPKRLTDGVMSNKPIYVASKKLMLMPVYVDKAPAADSGQVKYPSNGAFVFSNDQKSLSLYSSLVLPDSLRIHDEPQLVETSSNGEFLVLLRTTKGIYSASSIDYGKTWSEPKAFTAAGPTTSSRFYIGKLASGNLLLVSNNSTTRNNMTASLSKDGGKTWPYQLLLDARENVSYPDADQSSDGNIHVVFDRDRTGAKDILYFRFTEDDILKGLKENVFKSRVNK